jgi:hypothetical protein
MAICSNAPNLTPFNFLFLVNIMFAFLFREMSFLPSLRSSGPNRMRIRTENRIACRRYIFLSYRESYTANLTPIRTGNRIHFFNAFILWNNEAVVHYCDL